MPPLDIPVGEWDDLYPGYSKHMNMRIDDLFLFELPGSYTVAIYVGEDVLGRGEDAICSNTIEFNVIPAAKASGKKDRP